MIVWYSDNFFKIPLLLGGHGVNIYLTFLKNLYEFSSSLLTGSCKTCQLSVMKNLTNQNWSRGKVTYRTWELLQSYYQRISQSNCFFFASWRRLHYPSLLMLWISSLAAFLRVSLDWLINIFYVALNTENRKHT